MMFSESITPYVGIGSINLYQRFQDVKARLDEELIPYSIEVWSADGETVPNPWQVLTIDNVLSLFFARNDKLFKIVCWSNYSGCLPNGIHTRMNMDDACALDTTLKYDDWNEDYESSGGYWIEDDPSSGTVLSISIFIRELLDEDNFDQCKW